MAYNQPPKITHNKKSVCRAWIRGR